MRREKRDRGPELVTAAEIAAFVYCPESWRLEHGLGLEPRNRQGVRRGRPATCQEGGHGVDRGMGHCYKAAAGRAGGCGVAPALGALPMMVTPWMAAVAVLAFLNGGARTTDARRGP